jgi:hypothetical protein
LGVEKQGAERSRIAVNSAGHHQIRSGGELYAKSEYQIRRFHE